MSSIVLTDVLGDHLLDRREIAAGVHLALARQELLDDRLDFRRLSHPLPALRDVAALALRCLADSGKALSEGMGPGPVHRLGLDFAG
jgi:hypothetical protein